MNILISACLLDLCCRYNGVALCCPLPAPLTSRHRLIAFCPEVSGGLPTPRPAAERLGDKILTQHQTDVTAAFQKGAERGLDCYRNMHCHAAILKSNSPSCGYGTIYDGTFTGTLTAGNGLFAELLADNHIPIFNEYQLQDCLQFLDSL